MKITDREIAVIELLSVFDGAFRTDKGGRACRECDGFVLVLEGQARYEFGGRTLSVRPGDVLYLPWRSGYRATVTQPPFRWICLDLRFEHPKEGLEPDVFHPGGKLMENAFTKLLRLWRMGDFSDRLLCKAIFYEIYAAITRSAATDSIAAEQPGHLVNISSGTAGVCLITCRSRPSSSLRGFLNCSIGISLSAILSSAA